MAKKKRSQRRQSEHDEAVGRSAAWYQGQGWKVQADVPGYERPDAVGGRRPDLIVQKARKKKVIEFETPDTLKTHEDQHRALERGAKQMGAEFDVRVAGEVKRRGKNRRR